jgi:hypothetical protein
MIKPIRYLVKLTSSAGANRFTYLKTFSFINSNPGLPMTPIAMIIKISGMPNASKPESIFLYETGKSEPITRGINKGLINPTISMILPNISFVFGILGGLFISF